MLVAGETTAKRAGASSATVSSLRSLVAMILESLRLTSWATWAP
jgi:hypothetical protein